MSIVGRIMLGSAAMLLAASAADATYVTSIKIKSDLPNYLQVAEVVATQVGTGTDVALASNGATATATSNYGGSDSPSYAIDGGGAQGYPYIYHSAGSDGSDYLLITLARAFDLSALSIYGRTDCCSERNYYAYQLYNGTSLVGSGNIDARNGAHVGTVSLPASVPEPASWAMMIGGFGMIGAAMRQSRRHVSVSFG